MLPSKSRTRNVRCLVAPWLSREVLQEANQLQSSSVREYETNAHCGHALHRTMQSRVLPSCQLPLAAAPSPTDAALSQVAPYHPYARTFAVTG